MTINCHKHDGIAATMQTVIVLILSSIFIVPLARSGQWPFYQQQQQLNPGNDALIVETSLGSVSGRYVQYRSEDGQVGAVRSFSPVPYAEAARGPFERSIRKLPWRPAVIQGREDAPRCPTINDDGTYNGAGSSLDCFHMEILSPDMYRVGFGAASRYPVLFWITGGGFISPGGGYDQEEIAKNIVSKGIIVVWPSYRVGAMGLFSTGPATQTPGNLLFWDLLLALQFVKGEIGAFGGDPNNIILTGQGAGAVAATLMALSPHTVNYYNKVIALSGNAWQSEYNVVPEEWKQRMFNFTREIGCAEAMEQFSTLDGRRRISNCVYAKDEMDVVMAQRRSSGFSYHWMPIVDGPSGFFPEHFDLLAQMQPPVPVLTGTTKDEGAFNLLLATYLFNNEGSATPQTLLPPRGLQAIDEQREIEDLCSTLASPKLYRANTVAHVNELCRSHYASQQDPLRGWSGQAIQMKSDQEYVWPTWKYASHMMAKGEAPLFLYSFDHVKVGPWWTPVGAFHNFDMFFVEKLVVGNYDFNMTNDDRLTQMHYVNFLTSFAISGLPQSNQHIWLPSNSFTRQYMSIKSQPQLIKGYGGSALEMWAEVDAGRYYGLQTLNINATKF